MITQITTNELALQSQIERLERDLVAADIRIANDALEIASLKQQYADSMAHQNNAYNRRVVERDAYQQAADSMAAAHKVERDGLTREQVGLALDAARLDWLLPVVTGVSDDEADNRTLGLARQLGNGLDGRQAIDAAMRGTK